MSSSIFKPLFKCYLILQIFYEQSFVGSLLVVKKLITWEATGCSCFRAHSNSGVSFVYDYVFCKRNILSRVTPLHLGKYTHCIQLQILITLHYLNICFLFYDHWRKYFCTHCTVTWLLSSLLPDSTPALKFYLLFD